MCRWIFALVAISAFAIHPAQAKGKFDGTYTGDATGKVFGQKVSVPVSFKIKRSKLAGKILVPGAGQVVSITGSVNGGSGHFIGFVTLQFGVTGQFTGKVTKSGSLTSGGSLFSSTYGTMTFKIKAGKEESDSGFRGTWVATHPPTQAVVRVDVKVTPQGIASLVFHTGSGQEITDNREVSDDGQVNSVINGFTCFVKLGANGKFTVSYQGVLATGSLTGSRTSTGGVLKTLAGAYAAINNSPKQGANKLRFVVANDRSLAGAFEFRNGSQVTFTNIVGDLNDFAGTTEGGISYFAKIASDGTFTLSYQSAAYGSGSFEGQQK